MSSPSASSRIVKASSSSPFFHAQLQNGANDNEEHTPVRDSIDGASWIDDDWEDYEDMLESSSLSMAASLPEAGQSSPSLRLVGSFHTHHADIQYPRGSPSHSTFARTDAPCEQEARGRPEVTSSVQADRGSIGPAESPSSPSNLSFTTAVMDTPTAPTHKYHYLTRSESAATFPPKPHGSSSNLQMYNQGYASSLNHLSPSRLRTGFFGDEEEESDDEQDITEEYSTARHPLSPIDESPSIQPSTSRTAKAVGKPQGDDASVHSLISSQSLFINRQLNTSRIRPSPSVSSFTSTKSSPLPNSSRTGQSDVTVTSPTGDADYDSPFPPRKHLRSFSALPIIPGSPRVSRYITEGTEADVTDSTASQKAGIPLSFNLSEFPMPPTSDHRDTDLNETASFISHASSVQTELTYLTAQDSIVEEARTPNDVRRQSRNSAAMQHASPQRKAPRANLPSRSKESMRLILIKSRILTIPAQKLFRGLKLHAPDISSIPEKFKQGEPGPAELLFWLGFLLGPWCWLIGGWSPYQANNGVSDPDPGGQSTQAEQQNLSHTILPMYRTEVAPARQGNGIFKSALRSLRLAPRETSAVSAQHGPLQQEVSRRRPRNRVKRIRLRGKHFQRSLSQDRDPWIRRCRVAASVSGLLMITLFAVALAVLARSL